MVLLLVIQGQIIGVTGTANISPDLGNHLHFEIRKSSCTEGVPVRVNPREYMNL